MVLQLRGFELILIEAAAQCDAVANPLLVDDGRLLHTTPRLWIGEGRSNDELSVDIGRQNLDFEITRQLDRRGSGSFLPSRPTRARMVRELLHLLDHTGIESRPDARLTARRAGMTAAAYGLQLRDCQRCALSAMLRRTGLLCIQSAAVDMDLVDPVWAAREVLNAIPALLPIRDPVLCYRERWDGSGRPQGWSGEDIPILARIVAVVDSYQLALAAGHTRSRALARITAGAGRLFEPRAVQALTLAAHHPEWEPVIDQSADAALRASVA